MKNKTKHTVEEEKNYRIQKIGEEKKRKDVNNAIQPFFLNYL